MWNTHNSTAGKNQSTVKCVSESAGYTFSLSEFMNNDGFAQSIPAWSNVEVNTKAPLILLTLGIAFIGLSWLGFVYGLFTAINKTIIEDRPLFVLRLAFFASIAAPIMMTISSAKITATAAKASGIVNLETMQAADVQMHTVFYVISWLATGLLWVALVLVLIAAFSIAKMQRNQTANEDNLEKQQVSEEETQKKLVW